MSKRKKLSGGSPLTKRKQRQKLADNAAIPVVGLRNHHNTCYFNSALQVLYATLLSNYINEFRLPPSEPLARATADGQALVSAKKKRAFLNHLKATFHALDTQKTAAVSVKRLVTSFVATAPNSFATGRQEDAHEALRQMLYNIHRTLQEPAIHTTTGQTYQQSIVTDTFLGQLASRVQCSCCLQSNTSIADFLDLSIEIDGAPERVPVVPLATAAPPPMPRNNVNNTNNTSFMSNISSFFSNISTSVASTFTHAASYSKQPSRNTEDIALQTCLSQFFAREDMYGDNQYECNTCQTKTNGSKQMFLKSSSIMLCLHLKRFNQDSSVKLNRHVTFPLVGLNVESYMSPAAGTASENSGGSSSSSNSNSSSNNNSTGAPVPVPLSTPSPTSPTALYDLVGLIRHQGTGSRCGHYVAYVRHANGQWYECNDDRVVCIDKQQVQQQQAYVLMYQRQDYSRNTSTDGTETTSGSFSKLQQLLRLPIEADGTARHYSSSSSLALVDANPVRYLSSYWIKKRMLLRSSLLSGPVSNANVLCRHGCLLSRCQVRQRCNTERTTTHNDASTTAPPPFSTLLSRPMLPIPLALYNQLLVEEGHDFTTASSGSFSILETCEACEKEGEELNARRTKEKEYFDNLHRDHPTTAAATRQAAAASSPNVWYLLDTTWWRKWKEWYLNTRNIPLADQVGRDVWGMDEDLCGVLPPGPITNHHLFCNAEDRNSSSIVESGLWVPKNNLQPKIHYRGVSKEVWEFFHVNHGGGPAVMRDTLKL